MFDYFKGISKRLVFDNVKATKDYKAFATHYSFQTDFCNIASGNEKGLAENLVDYERGNFKVPVSRVKNQEELNQQLLRDCLNYHNTHKVESLSSAVKDAYKDECYNLRSIPSYRFDTNHKVTAVVGDHSTV